MALVIVPDNNIQALTTAKFKTTGDELCAQRTQHAVLEFVLILNAKTNLIHSSGVQRHRNYLESFDVIISTPN